MNALALWLLNYALNAVWQVPLVFACGLAAVRVARHTRPATRHRIWVGALALEVLLPACPVNATEALRLAVALLSGSSARQGADTAGVTVTMSPAQALSGLHLAHSWLVAAVSIYAAIVLFFTLRLAIGLHRTASLRRRAQPATLVGPARASLERYSRLFAVPDADIATSSEIAGPLTLGAVRRMLLLPSGFEQLGPDLDAALAHEFAHMRRHDYARNLAYQALSLPIAFHPLLGWTLAHIAETREIVCDALAAEAVDGREQYARSLLRLASLVCANSSSLAPHAMGILGVSPFNHFANFERRIMNLTHTPTQLTRAGKLFSAAIGTVIVLGCCSSALALRLQVTEPQAQAATPLPQTIVVAVPRTDAPPAQSFTVHVRPDSPGSAQIVRVMSPTMNISVPQNAAGPLKISGSVAAGNVLTRVMPIYPPEAKAAKIEGAVVLHAIIGKDGTFKSLELVSGPSELTHSAWEAVKQWTYKPYLLNGEPVEVETDITVHYSLAR